MSNALHSVIRYSIIGKNVVTGTHSQFDANFVVGYPVVNNVIVFGVGYIDTHVSIISLQYCVQVCY